MKRYRLAVLLMLVLLANPALGVRRRGDGYLVKAGDTASAICTKYNLTYTQFARLNPGIDINSIKAGERVRVSGTPEPAAPERSSGPEPEVSVKPDVVQAEAPARQEPPAKTEKPVAAVQTAPTAEEKPAARPAAAKPKPKTEAKSGGYLSKYYGGPSSTEKKAEPSVTASLLRVVGALVFVVALAVLSLYALKNFSSSKLTRKSPKRSINIIETAGLGPNRALHIVQAGSKFLLIGSTPTQINLVAELKASGAEEVDPAGVEDFASVLHHAGSAEDGAEAASRLGEALRDGATFLQKKSSATKSLRAKAEANEG